MGLVVPIPSTCREDITAQECPPFGSPFSSEKGHLIFQIPLTSERSLVAHLLRPVPCYHRAEQCKPAGWPPRPKAINRPVRRPSIYARSGRPRCIVFGSPAVFRPPSSGRPSPGLHCIKSQTAFRGPDVVQLIQPGESPVTRSPPREEKTPCANTRVLKLNLIRLGGARGHSRDVIDRRSEFC